MKRFRGTKGEWKVVIPDHIGCTNVQFGDDIFNGFIEVWHHQSSKEEATANAQLIATAPELLEELKQCVRALKVVSSFGATKNIIDRAENAINKALGL